MFLLNVVLVTFSPTLIAHPLMQFDLLTSSLTDQKMRAFLPVYRRYTAALQAHGSKGIKGMVAPDFTLRWGGGAVNGVKAVADIDKYAGGFSAGELAVKVIKLRIRPERVVAWTEETFTYKDGSGSMMWAWKQTWRKTATGWKLTISQKVDGKMPTSAASYTFRSPSEVKTGGLRSH